MDAVGLKKKLRKAINQCKGCDIRTEDIEEMNIKRIYFWLHIHNVHGDFCKIYHPKRLDK